MIIDIKNGLPPPPKRQMRKWPHADMAVGEYFEVRERDVRVGSLYVANWRWGKRLGRRYVLKQEDGLIRVWRVE